MVGPFIKIEEPRIQRFSDDAYWRRPRNTNDQKRDESGGETFVAMMQATDLRHGDDSSGPGWLDRARDRAIFIEGKMRAGSMVVVDVRRQDAAQMALVEDHNVIQVLTANRADHALGIWVLPG